MAKHERPLTWVKRQNPWIIGLLAICGTFVALLILGGIVTLVSPTEDAERPSRPQQDMPACELEDGSTQPLCIHDDGTGRVVINIDFGSVAYFPDTNTFTYYKDQDAR